MRSTPNECHSLGHGPVGVLISQWQSPSNRMLYASLAEEHKLRVDFMPFVQVRPVSFDDFRKQKVSVSDYTALILTSRSVVDQMFRLLEAGRLDLSETVKYFCTSEQVANYLQKYVVGKKRSIFKGKGTLKQFLDVVSKHKSHRFLLPRADKTPNAITRFLAKHTYRYQEVLISETVPQDLSSLRIDRYSVIAFFSVAGVKSFYKNYPDFEPKRVRIISLGAATAHALKEKGAPPYIEAPSPRAPSMVAALQLCLQTSIPNTNPA